MVHGGPDFGIYHPKSTVISIEDLGELAVRLGSIVNFDRKGDVLWLDDFEDGIDKWVKVLTAGRGSVEWSAAHSHNKGFSALLTSGATDGDVIGLLKYLPIPVFTKIGFEVSFTIDANIKFIDFIFYIALQDDRHYARIRHIVATNTWRYYDWEGEYQDLSPTVRLYKRDEFFHTVKFVFDLTTQYYSHLKVNDTIFDLSSYKYRRTGGNGSFECSFYIRVENNAAVKATSHIDNAIITQNEP